MTIPSNHPARAVLAGTVAVAPLALLWPLARHGIESRMALHMLLELPLLAASGWALNRRLAKHQMVRSLGRYTALADWRGWFGGLTTLLVAMCWMLPTLLDLAVVEPTAAAAKYLSWWLTGWLLSSSVSRMDPEVVLFTTGNLSWMTGTAGLLYIDSEQRLCVNYMTEDQRFTGIGLVVFSALLGGAAFWLMARPRIVRSSDSLEAQVSVSR